MLQKMPEPVDNATVLNTSADPNHIQALYLWEEGNVPAKTQFTAAMTGYFDNWDAVQKALYRTNPRHPETQPFTGKRRCSGYCLSAVEVALIDEALAAHGNVACVWREPH